LTRGPDAILAKGTTLEMVLDRPLTYEPADIDFGGQTMKRSSSDGPGPMPSQKNTNRRLPLGRPY
jgi:hypothetical protein